jgi:hypothetical protein
MARVKEEEETNPQGYRQFVEPPLIPGKPAFYRWIGYFDISDERVEEIKKSLSPIELEMLRGIPDFDPDAIIPDRDDSEER